MPIVWRDAMSVGNDTIDDDHRGLIDLINRVEAALQTESEQKVLTEVLDQLVRYTHEHFEREERLMRTVRYGGYVLHRQAHRELIVRLGRIRAEIEASKAADAGAERSGAVVALLRSWLVDHIFAEDLRYRPSLAGYARDYVP